MKNIIGILSLICLTTCAFAQAQRPKRPEPPSSQEMIQRATKELALTDQQITQWEEIHEKYQPSIKNRSKADATRKEMGQELKATLTDEQSVKFQKMKKNQGPPLRDN